MNFTCPLMTIEKSAEESLPWAIQLLEKAGLRVMRTFDLREARFARPDCSCPQHGTEACDCQMTVLLIYGGEQAPASLLVHSFQETTCLYLEYTPELPDQHGLDRLIQEILTQPVPGPVGNIES